jgi:hypothetical protein
MVVHHFLKIPSLAQKMNPVAQQAMKHQHTVHRVAHGFHLADLLHKITHFCKDMWGRMKDKRKAH